MPSLGKFVVSIAGQHAGADLLDMIVAAEVVARRRAPARFTLRLRPGPADLERTADELLGDTFEPGREVEISWATRRTTKTIVSGTVEEVGLDLDAATAAEIVITGYDAGLGLTREQKVRTFLDVSPSEVAAQLAAEHGLASEIDASETRTWIAQTGESDWDFLSRLAKSLGFDLFVADGKLHFRGAGKRGRYRLTWGRGLVSFTPSVTTSRQTASVTVHGWDPATKSAVEGQGGGGSEAVSRVEARAVRSVAEATELAATMAGAIERGARTAEGAVMPGQPKLMPGVVVDVQGIGDTLGGDYHVSAVTHSFSPDGYATSFVVGDRMLDLDRGSVLGRQLEPQLEPQLERRLESRFCGVVTGVVTDNEDPDRLARVRVRLPWQSDDASAWARWTAPMAGDARGVYFLPEIGDEVLVAFEHGDLRAPYVVGALWNGVDLPPDTNDDGRNDRRLIRSRSGHEILLDDRDGDERVAIVSRSGLAVTLDDGEERIEISDPGGNRLVLDSRSAVISVESAGDLELKAGGDLKLEATNVSLKASAEASVEGGAATELQSGGVLTINGALVRIN